MSLMIIQDSFLLTSRTYKKLYFTLTVSYFFFTSVLSSTIYKYGLLQVVYLFEVLFIRVMNSFLFKLNFFNVCFRDTKLKQFL